MNTKIHAVITALGGYVPENILDNHALEKMVDTTNDWIISRTGIKERRILNDPELATSDMATFAIQNLLETAQLDPSEIDCVIIATSTPDHILLPTASIVCDKANLTNAWGIDMNAACSGFLYSLSIGASLIESNRYKKVIVVGADQMSSIVDYTDRNTCILFGDGAGAVLLEQTTEEIGIIDNLFKTDGKGAKFLSVPAGGSKYPASDETLANRTHFIHQDGRTVFKSAINGMSETTQKILDRNNIESNDIDWLIPHQANLRIIQAVSEKLDFPIEKVKINIQKYGNTTAGTIPLCLWDFKDDFKYGDNIALTAFGAGFTWGTTYLKWGNLRNQQN
ncbi:beta-ketoacyl-ACP synthase III [Flavobacterium sp. '19STA2R22 D10 B1']|uniref:beta-ketoacyl-ACP synthase III n=1 Tax=Flavobacterium aerium TaxID=3037261 RepID=UPI00278BB75D|nr:beta-ketoacyl-ACP synthase III [Flavobacterium sp. '19STA2R22 D10 B1']